MKTDAELIRQARHDPDGLAELYRRHSAGIARWFGARAPRSLAGELTAETFAQAALSLRRFRDEADGSAAPWLFGIARNVLRRSLERERIESAARSRLGMPVRSYESDVEAVESRLDAAQMRPALLPAGTPVEAAKEPVGNALEGAFGDDPCRGLEYAGERARFVWAGIEPKSLLMQGAR